MEFKNSTVLITGGSIGIGLEFVKQLRNKEAANIIITGRNATKLAIIQKQFPDVHIFQSDVSNTKDIEKLFNNVIQQFPNLNILINNAGIMRNLDLQDIRMDLDNIDPYYHFMNFDDFKVESNASALVKFVTSLAASNIKHPILVMFDNDTTGIMEMKKLLSIPLGSNFRILKYPDLKSAKKYPTIGPTGIKKMDINGLACSIEMYLGSEILFKNGNVIPVHWKAYNEKEKKYQGELAEKSYVQDEFRKKLKSGNLADSSRIELILQMMFGAFQ